MSGKRKDNKGRVLKTGESQRKDQMYQYRYTDINGKRVTIYASDLQKLREKEKEIQESLNSGIIYSQGDITVLELVEKYVSLKQGVRYNTKCGYRFVINLLKNEAFAAKKIRYLKMSDAKMWVIKIFNDGYMYSTIKTILANIKPAFSMACEEDIIAKNPFNFKLSDVIPNESEKRTALTEEQQEALKDFIKNDKVYKKYYDIFIILLETGLRVSEFCGLTKSDLDFAKRKIKIDHQLLRRDGYGLYVAPPKSKSGIRFVPMTDNVYNSLQRVLNNRVAPKTERLVDGHNCNYRKQWSEDKVNDAVAEVIRKLVQNPKFETAIREKIGTQIDTAELETELEGLQKQLRQLSGAKDRLGQQIREYLRLQNRRNPENSHKNMGDGKLLLDLWQKYHENGEFPIVQKMLSHQFLRVTAF